MHTTYKLVLTQFFDIPVALNFMSCPFSRKDAHALQPCTAMHN